MAGGLIQLIAKTKHNRYLISNNPDVNNFKSVFKRSNHFSHEYIDIEPIGSKFWKEKIVFTVPLNAEYIQECILKIKLPALELPSGSTFINWTNSVGHAMIEKIEFSLGEYIIDTQDGLYYELIDELEDTKNKRNTNQLTRKYESLSLLVNSTGTEEEYVYIPLKFWFNKKISNALPLYLIKYHNIKINVYLRDFLECVIFDGNINPSYTEIKDIKLNVKYIYVSDTDLNMDNNQTFIITQTQNILKPIICRSNEELSVNLKGLNHPALELLLVFIEKASIANNDYFNFGKRQINPYIQGTPLVDTIKMNIDGNELYKEQDESFFRKLLQYNHHTNISDKFIYTIPFCQEPENHFNYTGSLNFSAIDESILYFKMKSNINDCEPYIYITNYNMLYIKDGLVGIQFIS